MMVGVDVSLKRSGSKIWWPSGAVFYADFANSRYMKNGIEVSALNAFSFSRSSEKMATDLLGDWQVFSSDSPAITNKGLLLEDEETYYATNSSFAGATVGPIGGGGAIPNGWDASGWSSVEVVSLTQASGLSVIVFDLTLDNTAGGSDAGRSIQFSSIATEIADQWTIGGYFELMQTFADDTCTAPSNIMQLQERTTTNGFLNNHEGVIGNLETSGLDTRRSKTKPIIHASAAKIAAFYSWVGILPGELFHRRCAISMPTATKGGTLSTPLSTTDFGTNIRAADIATLQLPLSSQNMTILYDDGSTVETLGVSGETPLPLNTEKAITSVTTKPS